MIALKILNERLADLERIQKMYQSTEVKDDILETKDAIEYLRDYEARQARRIFEFNYVYERPYFKQVHSVSKNVMFLKEILADLKELGYVCTYEGATANITNNIPIKIIFIYHCLKIQFMVQLK